VRKLVVFLQGWGPLGAFCLAVLDSAGVPLPASVDVLLIAVAATNPGLAMLSAGLSVLGSAIGSMFLFSIARKGGQMYLERKASSPKAMKFREWFARYGLATVFVPALVPIIPLPLKVFVLSAGALGVKPLHFLGVVLVARVLRYYGLALLGMRLGEGAWPWLRSHALDLGLAALVLFAAIYASMRWFDARRVRYS